MGLWDFYKEYKETEQDIMDKLWRDNFVAIWHKKWGKALIIGVILFCIGVCIYEMPRETDMYSALIDGIENNMRIKAENIEWENVDFPLYSEDNKNWIASNKSPQAVEEAVRNKLSEYRVLEKGRIRWTPTTYDMWIHINSGKGIHVKINDGNIFGTNYIRVFYNGQTAILYEIK